MAHDNLYRQAKTQIDRFVFDEKVASVFGDMISRSVPGYHTIIAMTGILADKYVQPGSRVYDLGSSLGTSLLAVDHETGPRNCTLVAVDNSPAMLQRCATHLANCQNTVELVESAIQDIHIHNASMVILNFTLQFLPVAERATLLQTIYAGMRPGGVLLLSEKIQFADADLQTLNTDLHHAFKRSQGYSELEISQKRDALDNVLIPETLDTHKTRLADAGFERADVWFQCFNFASLVALKT